MSRAALALAARREALVARSGELREELHREGGELAVRFRVVDRIVGVARSGPARGLLIGAAALVLLWRPRKLLKLASRALLVWPLVKPFLPSLMNLWRDPPTEAS